MIQVSAIRHCGIESSTVVFWYLYVGGDKRQSCHKSLFQCGRSLRIGQFIEL